jgi:hypothetical protein
MNALRLNLLAFDRHCVPFPYNKTWDDMPRVSQAPIRQRPKSPSATGSFCRRSIPMEENPTGCLDRDLDLMAAPAANTCAVGVVAFSALAITLPRVLAGRIPDIAGAQATPSMARFMALALMGGRQRT